MEENTTEGSGWTPSDIPEHVELGVLEFISRHTMNPSNSTMGDFVILDVNDFAHALIKKYNIRG